MIENTIFPSSCSVSLSSERAEYVVRSAVDTSRQEFDFDLLPRTSSSTAAPYQDICN